MTTPISAAEWAIRCWKEHGPTTMPFERLCIKCAEQYAREQVETFRERAATVKILDECSEEWCRHTAPWHCWQAAIRAL